MLQPENNAEYIARLLKIWGSSLFYGAPITRFGIRYVVAKYAAKATAQCPSLASKNVTVHTLRHTTAMHLLRAGNDIVTVSYWFGHADINTTHVYLDIDMEMKR